MTMGFHPWMVMTTASLVSLIVPISVAQNNCDFFQQIYPGQKYSIYNKEYPNLYGKSTSCKWLAQTIEGYRIVLSCNEIQIPDSRNCRGDRLSISLTGELEDGKNYCGTGTLSVVSERNALAVGLLSTADSTGGKFYCEVTAIAGDQPTTSTPKPSTCDCGWKPGLKIIGGVETAINEFPYMAALMDVSIKVVRCGANIISDRYALTAAHCLISRTINELALRVGEHNVKTTSESPYTKQYALDGALVHPEFDIRTLKADLAILQTQEKMQFSLYVGPVCLPFRYSTVSFDSQPVTIAGWGLREYSGALSDTLQKAQLYVLNNNKCASEISDRPVTERHICAYADNKDACQSDSGGPLYWYDNTVSRNYLIGVISFGRGCDFGVPGVNTRMTSYLPWIISATPNVPYCIK